MKHEIDSTIFGKRVGMVDAMHCSFLNTIKSDFQTLSFEK